jgi:hypothetical protein
MRLLAAHIWRALPPASPVVAAVLAPISRTMHAEQTLSHVLHTAALPPCSPVLAAGAGAAPPPGCCAAPQSPASPARQPSAARQATPAEELVKVDTQ